MVALSAPRDARSKTPPGPEGSNGIDRRGRRGQPAGSSPFLLRNSCADRRRFIFASRGDGICPHRTGHIRSARQQRYRSTRAPRSAGGVIALSMLRIEVPGFCCANLGVRLCASDPRPFGAPPYQGALLRSTSRQSHSRRVLAIFRPLRAHTDPSGPRSAGLHPRRLLIWRTPSRHPGHGRSEVQPRRRRFHAMHAMTVAAGSDVDVGVVGVAPTYGCRQSSSPSA